MKIDTKKVSTCGIIFKRRHRYSNCYYVLGQHRWTTGITREGVVHISDISGEALATEDFEYVTRIHSQYAFLSKQQKKITDYILTRPDSGSYSSITLLAKRLDISTATISRFCQVLSYKGFSEMKLYMSKKTLSSSIENNLIKNSDSLSVVLQKLAPNACDAINDIIRILDPATTSNVVDESLNANIINFYGQNGGYILSLIYISEPRDQTTSSG